MGEERSKVGSRGSPEGLKEAIERTFAATAGPAAEGRDRARELLDEVARRGRDAVEAGEELARRSREAGDELARRGIQTGEGLRDAVRELIEKSQPGPKT